MWYLLVRVRMSQPCPESHFSGASAFYWLIGGEHISKVWQCKFKMRKKRELTQLCSDVTACYMRRVLLRHFFGDREAPWSL